MSKLHIMLKKKPAMPVADKIPAIMKPKPENNANLRFRGTQKVLIDSF